MSERTSGEPIAALMPHARTMCWLHTLVEASDEHLVAEALAGLDHPFAAPPGIAIWHGLEYMAQAVAAWAGWRARQRGEPPKIGFLLGTRRYEFSRPALPLGETLRIHVQREFFADNGLGMFRCEIRLGEERLAHAALSVFEPPNADDFLKGHVVP
jgi:predicted hotdog family 3-hydroxylacyl-ACP dehydratase